MGAAHPVSPGYDAPRWHWADYRQIILPCGRSLGQRGRTCSGGPASREMDRSCHRALPASTDAALRPWGDGEAAIRKNDNWAGGSPAVCQQLLPHHSVSDSAARDPGAALTVAVMHRRVEGAATPGSRGDRAGLTLRALLLWTSRPWSVSTGKDAAAQPWTERARTMMLALSACCTGSSQGLGVVGDESRGLALWR